MNQLRSIREFNRSRKNLIVFYTVDSQWPGQTRTTDHWVQQRIGFVWSIRSVMTSSRQVSPLFSSDALAFGDILVANRHTCVLESSNSACNGLEIDDPTLLQSCGILAMCKPNYPVRHFCNRFAARHSCNCLEFGQKCSARCFCNHAESVRHCKRFDARDSCNYLVRRRVYQQCSARHCNDLEFGDVCTNSVPQDTAAIV